MVIQSTALSLTTHITTDTLLVTAVVGDKTKVLCENSISQGAIPSK